MRKDMHTLRHLLSISAAAVFALTLARPSHAASCEDLVNLKLPNTVIKTAQRLGPGEFSATGRGKQPDFPAFCRVVASVKPSPDSDIGVEVPLEDGLVWAALHQDAIVVQLPDQLSTKPPAT